MSNKIFGNLIKLVVVFLFGCAVSIAQPGQANTAVKTLSPQQELEDKVRKSFKSPTEFVANLSEFINKFPYSERSASYFSSLRNVLKDTPKDESKSFVDQLIKNTEQIPRPAKFDAYRHIANVLYDKGFYQESADLAQKLIDLFDEKAFLEYKAKQNENYTAETLAKNPNYKARPFDIERTRGSYVGLTTNAYNLLAKGFWEQGKFGEAEKAYRNSFAIKVSKESALGIARAAEKNGKPTETLKYATVAALTGKLEPQEMDYFYAVYAKNHQGKTDKVEEFLDAEFKITYRNPVKGEKYKPTSTRSNRVVLAEFFTGAGCVPCIPVDYTFETALENYSSEEIALLVYHSHAPTWDPLSNYSSDSRGKYYGINSAPVVFIDGKKSDKAGDYNGSDGEQNEIQEVARGLNEEIRRNLEIPAEANLKLEAKQSGQIVKVDVEADKVQNVSDDVSLQIALVENEASYSGENGLRFHPMVVRALAGDNNARSFGFKIDPSKANEFTYVFDVNKIVAQNADYYETFPVEKMKEFAERFGVGKGPEVKFKYKKQAIDAKHLSVIAFLQDNKTKKILQSSWVNLVSK